MPDNLKPCPFCGGAPEVYFVDDEKGSRNMVGCTKCDFTASPEDWNVKPCPHCTTTPEEWNEWGKWPMVSCPSCGYTLHRACWQKRVDHEKKKMKAIIELLQKAVQQKERVIELMKADHITDGSKMVEGESNER